MSVVYTMAQAGGHDDELKLHEAMHRGGRKADNPFKGAELETFRRALAAGICNLEAALK